MFFVDDLVVVVQSTDESMLVVPVVTDILQGVDLSRVRPLSPTMPPADLIPVFLVLSPPLPVVSAPTVSSVVSAPPVGQGFGALRQSLRSQQCALQAVERVLTRLVSID